jgi:methylglutaconyl-CoA hydratase
MAEPASGLYLLAGETPAGRGVPFAPIPLESPRMSEVLLVERSGPVVTLTLNRPDKRNALNAELVEALLAALRVADADEGIRAVVLTGAGKVFSAGADLAALESLQRATTYDNLRDSARLAALFEAIYRMGKPVIARVNGHAIAGGCGLASVCDFSIASREARLGFTEVRIGFVPAIVGVFVLRKLGETPARDLMLRGHLVSAEEAARVGLITRAVDPDDFDVEVTRLADEIATETSPSAVALTKRLLGDIPGMGLREALDHAVHLNALARSTDDCREGIASFLRKEDPPWKRGA